MGLECSRRAHRSSVSTLLVVLLPHFKFRVCSLDVWHQWRVVIFDLAPEVT